MRSNLFLIGCVLSLWPLHVAVAQTEACFDLLERAEQGEVTNINPYDFCGFGDENLVWNRWAPYVSQHQMKRALYEICQRYPLHTYHDIYCEKSAQLGYGPAIALKAEAFIQKGDLTVGLRWATQAIETQELSTEQTGKLLETIGVYYYKKNDMQYRTYLEQAALRRSALANHLLSVITYAGSENNEANEKMSFQLIWRAILLGCPNAEENLGLFHLARQKKIPFETALRIMRHKMESCETTVKDKTQPDSSDEDFYTCRCKTAIENEKRFRDKPYLLIRIEGEQAVLQDMEGQEYQVSVQDNLPEQGTVAEVRKSAVILTYPHDRVILNLYQPDKCAAFCEKNHIDENLTPEEMQKRLMGDVGLTIQPYHLSFTPQECETLLYYAPDLVDVSLPFVGKKECESSEIANSQDSILTQILSHEQAKTAEQNVDTSEKIIEEKDNHNNNHEAAKQRLKQLDDDFFLD